MFTSLRRAWLGRQRGQSTVEYIVVTAFGILVLIEGGDSAPVAAVMTALKDAYRGFAYAISYSSTLMVF
ncbi:MAG TPA: hypothetical protein VL968_05570 [Rhodocyclaceae bacterium]|jgi:hypothetical protein|nr:hypothetical protein [Rhodocyclaceae bacterium]